MKGIVLAGGTGSRLLPLTKGGNKHLLPVAGAPMICHPIRKLTEAGIGEILVVTGAEHVDDVAGALGAGKDLGCRLRYEVQREPGGIAHALALAEGFAAGERACVILGDNVFQSPIVTMAAAFERQPRGARLVLKKVPDPARHGVAEVRGTAIVGIEEKPERPRSDLAVTGIYFYDAQVFDIIRILRPSARGELEITDVNREYLRRGELEWELLEGWWVDAGTVESYWRANALLSGKP